MLLLLEGVKALVVMATRAILTIGSEIYFN